VSRRDDLLLTNDDAPAKLAQEKAIVSCRMVDKGDDWNFSFRMTSDGRQSERGDDGNKDYRRRCRRVLERTPHHASPHGLSRMTVNFIVVSLRNLEPSYEYVTATARAVPLFAPVTFS
jgi:hypothetical protein